MRRNKFRQIKFVFGFVFFIFLSLIVLPSFSKAQSSSEYRAYWAETFNTQMGTRAEIDRIVDAAVQSNALAPVRNAAKKSAFGLLGVEMPVVG